MILTEKETREKLAKEEQIRIRIREDKNNPNYKFERLWVNGVEYDVEVGTDVVVPKTIYDMLVRKGII